MSNPLVKIFKSMRKAAKPGLNSRKNGGTVLSFSISVLAILVLLAACTSAAPTATTAPQPTATPVVPTATNTPVPTDTPASTATSAVTATVVGTATVIGTAVPTALDPCQLITQQEASTLAGASYGPGLEGTLSGNGKTCVYGSETKNVFFIEVIQAPDVATANAGEASYIAEVNANINKLAKAGLNVSQVPSYADGAITGQFSTSISGVSFSGIAFAFRKGTVFFGFSDIVVGTPAPSLDQMKLMGNTVLGRLP